MKNLLPVLITQLMTASLLAGAGSGPWSLGAYYPGQLDGKYQAAVYGNNITGVLGFALINGAPPFDELTSVTGAAGGAAGGGTAGGGTAGGGTTAAAVNADLGIDETQNYFAIFVQGRVYTGRTVGMVDIDRNTVTGTLIGAQPGYGYQTLTIGQAIAVGLDTIETQTDVPVVDNLPLLNRGLAGGFKAKLKNTTSLPKFQGEGQLSTPAQMQSISAFPNTFPIPRITDTNGSNPILITGFTPATLAAQIVTTSVPFCVYGVKTSFLSANPVTSTNAAATP